ncbi:MAG: M48 family metallopeptidase [Deltaproteobacteria bacterium]|nr:M48 family metallopeptidase [Deltaproteobacteria bacterium]
MARVSVRNLVRSYNLVRDRLRAGIEPASAPRFRSEVRRLLDVVERECDRLGVRAADLPGPSRAAYMALAAIDLDRLPAPGAAGGGAAVRVRLAGVARTEAGLAARMWRDLDRLDPGTGEFRDLAGRFASLVAEIEKGCAAAGAGPAALPPAARRLHAWLRFLDRDGLARHVAALRRARSAAARAAVPLGAVEVHLLNIGSLWRWAPRRPLRVSEGFVDAGDEVWEALVGMACSRRTAQRNGLVRRYAESAPFCRVVAALDPAPDPAAGRAHDLAASFDRVNAAMFGGQMDRPRLGWTRVPGTARLGTYRPASDSVTISVVLDDPEVPKRAVDYVMYHELLHRKHGAVFNGDRRHVHTAAFRADERRFPGWRDAEADLERATTSRR